MQQVIAHPGKVEGLRELLARHPHVVLASDSADAALTLEQNGRHRKIYVDNANVELSGLVELIDNNPLVCADEFSLPSPEATLALIGLGPLLRAGSLVEAPTALYNFEAREASVERALANMHWDAGILIDVGELDAGTVLTGVFMAVVESPEDSQVLEGLYEEVYHSSFYVRRDEDSEWSPEFVRGKPFAKYRIQVAADQPHSLVTVRVLADRNGKCGAAQVVHAMNVMCGFEESLGIC